MAIRFLFIWFIGSLSGQFVYTQSASPKLGLVFPLEEKNGRVYVKETCLISRNTILNKRTLLRVMFQLPRLEDADVKRAEKKRSKSVLIPNSMS
ncbi:MAG: hypothetical protein R3F23_07110 [Verrucomicrobiia bacterium]